MEILEGKYKLIPTLTGVDVINPINSKVVFHIKDDEDFKMFKQGDRYVIGCLTITDEEFKNTHKTLKNFQKDVVASHRAKHQETIKNVPTDVKTKLIDLKNLEEISTKK